ncbi:MAG: hypothetical protein ABIW31_04420 [Novosphingobium sp.]
MSIDRKLAAIAAVAAVIAVIAPFDVLFLPLTFGSPLLRAALMALLAIIGGSAAKACGLRLEGHGARSPLLIGLGAAMAVAAYVFALDVVLFRPLLSADYIAYLHVPLGERMAGYMLRAFNENVLYRLFLFPVIALAARIILRRDHVSPRLLIAAMVASQVINIAANAVLASPESITLARLGYYAIRYVVPGVLWAVLFRRHGFATAEVASVGCHVFLQPAFTLVF